MTRFFFPTSRSHHAFSMAKDFGMEFEKRFGKWEPEALVHLTGATGYKLYVHPESMDLLEPQLGDEGIDANGKQCCFIDDYDEKGGWYVDGISVTSFDKATGPVVIDKRNGLAFHSPELEPDAV